MITTILLARVAAVPAAVIAAAGVLGALHVRSRLQLSSATLPEPLRMRQTFSSTVDAAAAARVADHDDRIVRVEQGDSSGAFRLLDDWSGRPWSAWQELGRRCLRASPREAGAVAESSLMLESAVTRCMDAFEAWCIRDGADTAWQLAPRDAAPLPEHVEDAARRAVVNAALATFARAWLPAKDHNRLLARVA